MNFQKSKFDTLRDFKSYVLLTRYFSVNDQVTFIMFLCQRAPQRQNINVIRSKVKASYWRYANEVIMKCVVMTDVLFV